MSRRISLVALVLMAAAPPLSAQDAPPPAAEAPVSFMKNVAPILVESCVGCHNAKKAESKYDLTTFAKLAAGGAEGEGITLEPGDPEASYLIELIRPGGAPRMPYKQDALPDEKRAVLERWVEEGAKFDGPGEGENWVSAFHRSRPIVVPEAYPSPLPITALAFSPDGTGLLASGYHELNKYKVEDGSLIARLPGVGERVYDLAYSPDGKLLAAASGDPGQSGSASLWKVNEDGSLERLRELAQADDAVFAVAFRPDGKRLATAGADRTIRVFDVETGEQLGQIEDHADWIFDVAYSADGLRLASASRDKTSKVFDAEKFESLVTFPGHNDIVYCVGFAPDGKSVASGGQDARVRIWNPDDEAKQARELAGFGGPVFKLTYVGADGLTLAACSADKTVRLFNPTDGAAKPTLQGHADWVYSLAVAPDGQSLASGSWDGEVRLWKVADGQLIRTILAAPGYTPPAALVNVPSATSPSQE